MSFVEELRRARTGATPILHEFLTNYDPELPRIHAFVEGDDDVVFYKTVLQARVKGKRRVYTYRCGGKERVYEAFRQVVARFSKCRGTLFFVDKDLDDILGRPWPTDPRIFVTDVYSVENYVVSPSALAILLNEFVSFRGVHFDIEVLLRQFEKELLRFHKLLTPLMALITWSRRLGLRPNLENLRLGQLFDFSAEGRVRVSRLDRLEYVCRTAGITVPGSAKERISETTEELKRLPPKRFVRGRFEIWFFVEFFKRLIAQLERSALEVTGKVRLRSPIEHGNILPILAGRIEIPEILDRFLSVHLSPIEGDRPASQEKKVGFFREKLHRAFHWFVREKGPRSEKS